MARRGVVVGSLVVCMFATTRAVLAQPPTAPTEASEPAAPQDERYALQVIAVDAGALLLAGGGVLLFGSPQRQLGEVVLASAVIVAVAGGPVVHGLHHNRRGLVRSLVTRLAVPAATGLLGGLALSATSCSSPPPGGDNIGCFAGMVVGGAAGAGVGLLGAMIVDWAFFAKKPASDRLVEPEVSVDSDGATVFGLAGRF